MKKTQAGKLDRLVTLQAPVDTRTPSGEVVTSWMDMGQAWASADFRTGGSTERDTQGTVVPFTSVVYTLRYRNDLTEKWRLVDPGARSSRKVFQIQAILEGDTRKQWIHLVCDQWEGEDENPGPDIDPVVLRAFTPGFSPGYK